MALDLKKIVIISSIGHGNRPANACSINDRGKAKGAELEKAALFSPPAELL